jgi:hypothetical protein
VIFVTLRLKKKIHGAEGTKYLPVAIMEVLTSQKRNKSYKVVTQHGYLVCKYQRQDLHFMPLLTKDN